MYISFFITLLFTAVALSAMSLILLLFYRRRGGRRCACNEANQVALMFDERRKKTMFSQKYSPETVDPDHLPII
ncbi:MAG: hypothetical protein ACRCUY_01475 [Thermoguttaceae bacterium]